MEVACACKCGEEVGKDELTKQLDKIIEEYSRQPSGLIQVLHKAQELVGYCPKWVQVTVAEGLGVSLQEVYGVVTFYALFSLKPKGRYKISVCVGTACYVRGTTLIVKQLRQELGIKPGQTTDDSRFSLELVRCIGACGLGPAMIINQDVHGRLVPEQICEILSRYE